MSRYASLEILLEKCMFHATMLEDYIKLALKEEGVGDTSAAQHWINLASEHSEKIKALELEINKTLPKGREIECLIK